MNKFRGRIIKYFDEQYLKGGIGEEVPKLWPSKEYQLLRFRILIEIDDLNGKTILDVGCGFGEFYYFLNNNDVKLKDYVGTAVIIKMMISLYGCIKAGEVHWCNMGGYLWLYD